MSNVIAEKIFLYHLQKKLFLKMIKKYYLCF